jgi:hypothetical protein
MRKIYSWKKVELGRFSWMPERVNYGAFFDKEKVKKEAV